MSRLLGSLGARGVDAILVAGRANVRYLCGFTGSSGALLVRGDGAVLFTDSRYSLQAGEEVAGAGVEIVSGSPLRAAVRAVATGLRVGIEAEHVSMAAYEAIAAEARGAVLVPVRGVVERLREVKEPAEIECILKSVRLNSMAFEAGVAGMRDGVAEADVAAEIENAMRRRGAEAPAFESIVASGPRGALPHARASARVMRRGEAVVVDIGAMLEGYASDMTRAVFVGEPDATGRKVHGAVLDAVLRAEAEVRAGAAISKVDAAARDAVAAAGFGSEAYRHGTGHGVGLEVHEAPQVGAGAAGAVLEKGMVVTIEPGIYVPGWGGVRIEDVVVVEEGGCRVLTETPKTILTV